MLFIVCDVRFIYVAVIGGESEVTLDIILCEVAEVLLFVREINRWFL